MKWFLLTIGMILFCIADYIAWFQPRIKIRWFWMSITGSTVLLYISVIRMK